MNQWMSTRRRYLRVFVSVFFAGVVTGGCSNIETTVASVDEAVANTVGRVETFVRQKFAADEKSGPQAGRQAYEDAVRLRRSGDTREAVVRLKDAAGFGHPVAAYELGMLYLQGREVPKDLAASARWINRAADLGEPRAQYLVGANLLAGNGVERDPARGVVFLARAGEQGHVRAQYLLGQAYARGVGVPVNPAWAARWYGRAARAGHTEAQYAYAEMHANGAGVPRDRTDAYRWLKIAAINDHDPASKLAQSVAASLPRDVVVRLDTEAAGFKPVREVGVSDPPTVEFVQYTLSNAGFDPGPVDGRLGTRTRSGILSFQHASGLPADGKISVALLDRLVEQSNGSR